MDLFVKKLLIRSIRASISAGEAILKVYHSDFIVEKKKDLSPLTLADRHSHDIIVSMLADFGVPVLSEEGKEIPYIERKMWQQIWIVDPLDGTKEFIKRNGEFTVNVAFIKEKKPLMGIIFIPVQKSLYFGLKPYGAFKISYQKISEILKNRKKTNNYSELFDRILNRSTQIYKNKTSSELITIVGSRSHTSPEFKSFVKEMKEAYKEVRVIPSGSSLKFCLVAEGKADIYPRLGPTMEWDTAAGQAIVECAGGRVVDFDSKKPLEYNKMNLLNQWFVVN